MTTDSITEPTATEPATPESAPEWPLAEGPSNAPVDNVYEVFRQRRQGDAFTHVGEVEAPDHDTALLVAKEHFARRETCSALWVVDRQHIVESVWSPELLSSGREKNYRRVLGRRDSLDVLT